MILSWREKINTNKNKSNTIQTSLQTDGEEKHICSQSTSRLLLCNTWDDSLLLCI